MYVVLQIGQALNPANYIDLSHLSTNHMHLHIITSLI